MNEEWEEVSAPAGQWAKWETAGDTLTGWVVTYDAAKGTTDFNGDECGLLVLDDFESREFHNVTLSLASLKRELAAADPRPGLLIRLTYVGDEEANNGRTFKKFKVQVNRGVTAPERPAPDELEEPF